MGPCAAAGGAWLCSLLHCCDWHLDPGGVRGQKRTVSWSEPRSPNTGCLQGHAHAPPTHRRPQEGLSQSPVGSGGSLAHGARTLVSHAFSRAHPHPNFPSSQGRGCWVGAASITVASISGGFLQRCEEQTDHPATAGVWGASVGCSHKLLNSVTFLREPRGRKILEVREGTMDRK